MRNDIKYEWTIELIDAHNDIIDSDFSDTVEGLSRITPTPGNRVDIGLVRRVGNEIDGCIEDTWAYVKDGKLPEYFKDASDCEGAKVPQRFHQELTKYLSVPA